jgi:hypothetical protein
MIGIERDPVRLAGRVLSSSSGAAIKHVFGLDVSSYAWVKDYVRDQKTREEIKSLQEKIVETRALPIHRDEIKKMFEARVEQINAFRIRQFRDHLASVQERQTQLFNEGILGSTLQFSGTRMVQNAISFSPTEMDEIFSALREGIRQEDIGASVSDLQKEIRKLEEVLSRELSPQSRWFYHDNGMPEPYPGGCRWSLFVDVWKKVVSRFDGKVNIEGHVPETPEEFAAYGLLELDRVPRRTPLGKPIQ